MTTVDIPETSGKAGRPCGPRALAREQAILDAALELLLEVGYDRLSMDALAERAHRFVKVHHDPARLEAVLVNGAGSG